MQFWLIFLEVLVQLELLEGSQMLVTRVLLEKLVVGAQLALECLEPGSVVPGLFLELVVLELVLDSFLGLVVLVLV